MPVVADLRPFPPSPRRRALARSAGLHAGSPLLVGGVACAAAALAIAGLGAAAARELGGWIATVCATAPAARDVGAPGHGAPAVHATDVVAALGRIALPLLGALALAAIAAHLAQTRAGWLPRRRVPGAPALDAGSGARVQRTAFELSAAGVVGALVVGWLWLVAPRLAALPGLPLAGVSLVASALATLAIAWVSIGVLDALLRHRALASAMMMTAREQRDDARASGLDPRWKARLRQGPAADPTVAIPGSTLVILGDEVAVAIAWDPLRRPVPVRTAVGRRARASQLVALARRHRLPIHRDPVLAAALVGEVGPLPEAHWPRVAELVAAGRRER